MPEYRKVVLIESPYAGDVGRNTEYAKMAMLDSISRGEAPIATHLLHTQVLDDNDQGMRQIGMDCGAAIARMVDGLAVYVDYGISRGMVERLLQYTDCGLGGEGVTLEFRTIGTDGGAT